MSSTWKGFLVFRMLSHAESKKLPFNVADRAIEHDLLPWCAQHAIPVMASSPLGGASSTLLRDPTLARIGAAHGCSAAAVALAWTIRNGKIVAIAKSGNVAHVREKRSPSHWH